MRVTALALLLTGCAGEQSYSPDDGAPTTDQGTDRSTGEGLVFPDAVLAPDALDTGDASSDGGNVDLYPTGDLGNLNQILLVALNQAHTGNLGGIKGADSKCQAQAKAAGQVGVFRAFLSDASQNVKDLVGGPNAALPVVNTKGQVMFKSWAAISTGGAWTNGVQLHTFTGTAVDDHTGAWSDADIWTGSNKSGAVFAGRTCQNWTSASGSVNGQNGEADAYELLRDEDNPCNETLAVVCVRLVP
jgi:hypothetical protein